jgi:acyl-coenzyme A synthetase/AMP-(fatty) acid ligase
MLLSRLCLHPAHAERAALVCESSGRTLSYRELQSEVTRLADALRAAGVGAGMRLCLALPASIEFAVALLASLEVGSAAAPLDLSLKGESLTRSIHSLQPHAVLSSARTGDRYASLPSLLGLCMRLGPQEYSVLRGVATGFAGLLQPSTQHSDADEDHDALLISTSGTTGWPKYVRLGSRGTAFNVSAHLESFGFSSPMRNLQVLAVNYSYGCIASLLGTLAQGGTLIFPARLDAEAIGAALRRHRPDTVYVSPALLEYLVDAAGTARSDWFASVTRIGIGGDSCQPGLRQKIMQALPDVQPYVTYGVTEAGPRVSTLPPSEFLRHPRSVGLPLSGVSVSVLDDEARPCEPGQVGHLVIATPSAMRGYLGHAASNGAPVRPGDLASVDEGGRLTLHGRTDRQMKVRGTRVHPNQIETLLADLSGVRRCEVRLDEIQDRLVADVMFDAALVPDPARLEQDLRRHCRMHLPNRQVPAEFRLQEVTGYFFKGRQVTSLNLS